MGLDDEPICVLHVDDEPVFSDLMAEFLERENGQFDVDTAASVAAGLDTLGGSDYDCIVSDYEMPEGNGVEFLRAVREEYPELPFVLCTGRGSEAVASEAISAGVTDYFRKEAGTEQYAVLANRIENAVGRQRTERELEHTREYFGTILAHASDFVVIVDKTGLVDYVSPAVERVLGYDPDDLEGTSAFEFIHPDDRTGATNTLEALLDSPGVEREVEFRARQADGSWEWVEARGRNLLDDPVVNGVVVNARPITERKERERELELADTVVKLVGTTRDVTERKRYEQALSALHDATNEFAAVGTGVETAEHVVTAMVDVAGLSNAAVYLYDDGGGVLRPIAQSLDNEQLVEEPPTFQPGEGITWRAFATESTIHYDDVREADTVFDPETDVRSLLIVPLGEHGVIVAGDSESGAFDARDRELAEIIAAAAETAFDSVAQTERLRERKAELDDQASRLDRVNQLNDAIRSVNRGIVAAESREVILQTVCDRIAGLDFIDFAWVGEPDPDASRLSLAAWAGADRRYLDTFEGGVGVSDAEPAVRAARSRGVAYVPNVAGAVQSGDWRTAALRQGYAAALSVPFTYGDSLYGVLSVYAGTRDVFDEAFQEVLAELGDLVGLGMNAIDRRDALLGRRRTAIELALRETDEPAGLAARLAEHGVRSQSISFDGADGRIVATLPSTVEPSALVADIQASYPGVSLAATEVEREAVAASDAFLLTDELTDAQREAVEAAHEAGFFEWPRDSTSEEVATALGISQPAFSQRLRTAQGKVFDAYCRGARLRQPGTDG